MSTRIPISKDDFSFGDKKSKVWEDMERDMDKRRMEWDDEIERMRRDFFTLKPKSFETVSDKFKVTESVDDVKSVIENDKNGQPVFRARFDVKTYKPEEVTVKMEANKVVVHAKHQETDGNSSVSREFTREVNIPREVDPLSLQCTISQDGVLMIEGPLQAPDYTAATEFKRISPRMTPLVTSTLRSSPLPIPVDTKEKKFKVELDIDDFKPEDIMVKTLDKKLVISARREEKGAGRSSSKEMNRELNLPDNVDPLTVKAFFSEDGKLLIEAPLRPSSGSQSNEKTNSPHVQSNSPVTCR